MTAWVTSIYRRIQTWKDPRILTAETIQVDYYRFRNTVYYRGRKDVRYIEGTGGDAGDDIVNRLNQIAADEGKTR